MGFNPTKYGKFEWYFSGLPSQQDAEEHLEDSLHSFDKAHDKNEWAIVSTVKQTQYGWACGFTATKEQLYA